MIKIMMLFHGSIRKKLYMLVLLATLPVFLVLLTTELFNRKKTIIQAEKDVSQILDSLSEIQLRITDSTRALLRTIASTPEIMEMDSEKSKTILTNLLDANPIYMNAILVDPQGNMIAEGRDYERAKNLNFSDHKQFIDAIKTKGFSSGEFVIGTQSQEAIFPFGIAVIDTDGNLVGAIILGVLLNHYKELFENSDYYENNVFGISDHNGIRLFRYPFDDHIKIGMPIQDEVYQATSKDKIGSIITENSIGKRFIIAYTPLRTEPGSKPYMYMFLGHDYSAIQQQANSILLRLIITSILSLFLSLMMVRFAGQKIIARQIERLSFIAREFSQGNEAVSSDIDYSDGEFGNLASTFDSMVANISSREVEKNALIQQLNEAQKMDAIGQLAGGIAHDFNNLLSGILGAAELLEFHLPKDSSSIEYQKIIVKSATRAADLARQLLAFSRTSSKVSVLIDMHSLIDETVLILKNTVDRRIEIIKDLNASSSVVFGDPSLLQSALLNLVINASQAISTTGRIEIATNDVILNEPNSEESIILKAGTYINIEVRDNGCGIPKEFLDKIFEPFFTTKDQGQGTGLGLSAVYGTIKKYGGSIKASSDELRGTVFKILLPNAEGSVLEDTSSSKLGEKGTGTILVVDDEETLRRVATIGLEKLGYKTISASNGQKALDIIKQNDQQFDLVLLDMIMPEMNGKDCFFELMKIAPEIPVLLCSGMISDEDLQEMTDSGLGGFLSKPYMIHELSKAVAELL